MLNLYSRDTATMAPLIAAVRTVYSRQPPPIDHRPHSADASHQHLLTALVQALTVRDTIQLATGVLMAEENRSAADAYRHLRLRAAETGISLIDAATALLDGVARPADGHPDG